MRTMYQAIDGQLFKDEESCKNYEQKYKEHKLEVESQILEIVNNLNNRYFDEKHKEIILKKMSDEFSTMFGELLIWMINEIFQNDFHTQRLQTKKEIVDEIKKHKYGEEILNNYLPKHVFEEAILKTHFRDDLIDNDIAVFAKMHKDGIYRAEIETLLKERHYDYECTRFKLNQYEEFFGKLVEKGVY